MHANKLTRAAIVATLQQRFNLSANLADDIAVAVVDEIVNALSEGRRVELRGFGSFRIRVVNSRLGRNPKRPNVEMKIKRQARVRFRAGKHLQAKVALLTDEFIAKGEGGDEDDD